MGVWWDLVSYYSCGPLVCFMRAGCGAGFHVVTGRQSDGVMLYFCLCSLFLFAAPSHAHTKKAAVRT